MATQDICSTGKVEAVSPVLRAYRFVETGPKRNDELRSLVVTADICYKMCYVDTIRVLIRYAEWDLPTIDWWDSSFVLKGATKHCLMLGTLLTGKAVGT